MSKIENNSVYIKIGLTVYKLSTGRVIAVNTERKSIKILQCIPSAYTKDLEVITEHEFKTERYKTGL